MRLVLLVLTLASGPVVALLVDVPTFAAASVPVQSTTSVVLPLLAIVLDRDRRPVTIGVVAVLATSAGSAGCALVSGTWDTRIAMGGLLVQVLAALLGVVAGRLVGRVGLAMLAVTAVPIGCWALLGAIGATTARAWLTPYGVATDLLVGTGGGLVWVRWLLVAAVWGLPGLVSTREH